MVDFMIGFRELGFAIVNRAIQDYINGCKLCKKVQINTKRYDKLLENYLSAVDFFLSKDFNLYCDLDGEAILSILEEEYGFFESPSGELL